MINRRAQSASSCERLPGRRASQKHGCKAAGTRAAAAEAAAPPSTSSRPSSNECAMSRAAKSAAKRRRRVASFVPKMAIFEGKGPFGAKISSPAARLKRKVGSLRSPIGDPPIHEHPRHLAGGGRLPGAFLPLAPAGKLEGNLSLAHPDDLPAISAESERNLLLFSIIAQRANRRSPQAGLCPALLLVVPRNVGPRAATRP